MYDDKDLDRLLTPDRRSLMRHAVSLLPWATDPRFPAPSEVSDAVLNMMAVVVDAAHTCGHEHERDGVLLVLKGHMLDDSAAVLEVEGPADMSDDARVALMCTALGGMLDELEDEARESAEVDLLRAGLRVVPRLLDERAQGARGQR